MPARLPASVPALLGGRQLQPASWPAWEGTLTPGARALRPQDHYDWGLRAIKSVLVVAGSLKRGDPSRAEDQVLMRALRDFNIPKIVTDDLPVFMGLIGDLFPALDVPRKRDLNFEKVGTAGPGSSPGAQHTCRMSGWYPSGRHSAGVGGPICRPVTVTHTCGHLPLPRGTPRGRQLPLRPWQALSQCWGVSRKTEGLRANPWRSRRHPWQKLEPRPPWRRATAPRQHLPLDSGLPRPEAPPGPCAQAQRPNLCAPLPQIIKQSILELRLQAEDSFVLKVVQLEELLHVRHSVFVIGNAGSGKSQARARRDRLPASLAPAPCMPPAQRWRAAGGLPSVTSPGLGDLSPVHPRRPPNRKRVTSREGNHDAGNSGGVG